MSSVVAVISAHRYRADSRSCSCDAHWYDTRQPQEQDLHEHGLHVEKELLDTGVGEISEARTKAFEDIVRALVGESPDSYYMTRRRELSAPYSKPMLPEQWSELDGIESSAAFIRKLASVERIPG